MNMPENFMYRTNVKSKMTPYRLKGDRFAYKMNHKGIGRRNMGLEAEEFYNNLHKYLNREASPEDKKIRDKSEKTYIKDSKGNKKIVGIGALLGALAGASAGSKLTSEMLDPASMAGMAGIGALFSGLGADKINNNRINKKYYKSLSDTDKENLNKYFNERAKERSQNAQSTHGRLTGENIMILPG